MEEVETVADRIARNGPLSLKKIKESVITCMGLPIKEGFMREYKLGREVFESKDAREGPQAFMEKREPRFIDE
jgi:enoyl-CoA hydratase